MDGLFEDICLKITLFIRKTNCLSSHGCLGVEEYVHNGHKEFKKCFIWFEKDAFQKKYLCFFGKTKQNEVIMCVNCFFHLWQFWQ